MADFVSTQNAKVCAGITLTSETYTTWASSDGQSDFSGLDPTDTVQGTYRQVFEAGQAAEMQSLANFSEGLDICRHWYASSEYGNPYCCQQLEMESDNAHANMMVFTTNAATVEDQDTVAYGFSTIHSGAQVNDLAQTLMAGAACLTAAIALFM